MGEIMSKVMETTPLTALLERIAGEYRAKGSIYEIPERAFQEVFALEEKSPGMRVMGHAVSFPIGPAAGPHTQIAPNLIAAYLAGSRVFELKTVQVNDRLDIEKPCIFALDEGHNAEWSTELSLKDAREEYVRAWIAVNLLAAILSPKPASFLFNLSVGYDLAGIQSGKMDEFIEGMRAPASTLFWKGAMEELAAFVDGESFVAAFGAEGVSKAHALLGSFPAIPIHSVTVSTMHGCPPQEIERIGAYLIEAKGFDTFVKLNPTLLGYDVARGILDATGWKDIVLQRETFEHDLQFRDAIELVLSLRKRAERRGRNFGIKLSNTLANRNDRAFLPGAERYMSGRALFPITIRLAADLAAALPGWGSPFSYCGGVSAGNAAELIRAGAGPITVATEILKPGGYLRLGPIASAAAHAIPGSPSAPDPGALAALAAAALSQPEYRKDWKTGRAAIAKPLPLFDCFAAPCVEACPANQKVPEYIGLAAAGAHEAALATILADNPLPHITGTLCDHVCQDACCRNDYEGAVEIRRVKLSCAHGACLPVRKPSPRSSFEGKVAVIGAGPGGLACAHDLASAGVPVTVFDKNREPGGVPASVIPWFRIPREDLAKDINRIKALGVEFRMGTEVRDLSELRARGYSAFFVSPGAQVPRELALSGSGVRIVDALAFLSTTGPGSQVFAGAKHIVVVGGGNTAVDSLRAALRLPDIVSVRLSYRRSLAELPADREELQMALREGRMNAAMQGNGVLTITELSVPERIESGRLVLRRIELGEKDASGRPTPRPTEAVLTASCDLLVVAVGEVPDPTLFASLGIPCGQDGRPAFDPQSQATRLAGVYVGGDAARGPASIISAVSDGRRAARAILRSAGIDSPASSRVLSQPDPAKLAGRGRLTRSVAPTDGEFVRREAERCLRCDSACLRCVEVCPNRANMMVNVGAPAAPVFQILHVDALCNECGNCGLFCPWQGEPFRGKATFFDNREKLTASGSAGFAFIGAGPHPDILIRSEGGGQPRQRSWQDWSTDPSTLAELARVVLRDHRYLRGATRGARIEEGR